MRRAELPEVSTHPQHSLETERFEVVQGMRQGLQDKRRQLAHFLCIRPTLAHTCSSRMKLSYSKP